MMDGVCSLDVDVDTSFPTPSLPSPKLWKPFGIIALVEVGLSNLLGKLGNTPSCGHFAGNNGWSSIGIGGPHFGHTLNVHSGQTGSCFAHATWNWTCSLRRNFLVLNRIQNIGTPQLVDHQLLYWITTILRIYTPFSDTAIFLHMIETKYSEICGWTVGFLNVKRGSRNWHLYP